MTEIARSDWHRRLTPVAATITALMLGAVVLSVIPVGEVEFAVEGRAQALSVDLAEAASMDAIPATESTIATNGSVALSSDPGLKVDEGSEIVLFANAEAPMTLKDVLVPEHWQLDIEAPAVDALRIFAKPTSKARPDAIVAHYLLRKGSVIQFQEEGATRRLRISEELVKLDVGAAPLDIRVRPTASTAPLFISLKPSVARFQTPEVEQASESPKTTAVGTIERGKLWVAHKGEAKEIGLLDMIEIDGIADGFLRPLVAEPGGLTFGLRGTAQTLMNTPGTQMRSLKPSLLDYLVDNGLIKILAAIFSFVLGVEVTRLIRR